MIEGSNDDNKVTAQDVLAQVEGAEVPQAEEQIESIEAQVAEGSETEPKVEEEKEPEQSKEEKLFASKFAALSRKEKAIRERERQLEARMQELEQRLKAKEEPPAQVESEEPIEFRLKRDPFGTLKNLGLDYETLTKIALNDGKLTPEIQMQLMKEEMERQYGSKFKELEEKLTEKEKREQEEKHNQVVQNFKSEIASFVKENATDLELLSVEGDEGVQLVYDVIEEHYNESGKIMDKQEAANLVEEYLLEEAKKRVGLSKIKKLLGASEQKTPSEPKQQKSSVTLSNEQAQTSQPANRFLSDDESKANAAKLIRWVE